MHDSIAALVEQEGWRAEGDAARVHYDGGGDRFAVEFYAGAERVLYWTVPAGEPNVTADAGEGASAATAAPVPRERLPNPLRRRIREDLEAAGVDPDVERREV